jgi:uncharacterized metal-binding protein
MKENKIYIIPCSGIGKATASVGRETVYKIVEDLMPEDTDTLCLSLLTMGDEEAREKVIKSRVVTIDGCGKDCARKNVEATGKIPDISHRTHDYLKKHRDLQPEGVLDVGDKGRQLTEIMAADIAAEIERMLEGGK